MEIMMYHPKITLLKDYNSQQNPLPWKYSYLWNENCLIVIEIEIIKKKITAILIVSKIIQVCFVFALSRSVIGPKNSSQTFNQSNAKLKTNHDLVARVFPRLSHFWSVLLWLLIGS